MGELKGFIQVSISKLTQSIPASWNFTRMLGIRDFFSLVQMDASVSGRIETGSRACQVSGFQGNLKRQVILNYLGTEFEKLNKGTH